MDAQYRQALLTGSFRLRVLALAAIVIHAITSRLERMMRFVQETAPTCDCGQNKALSCGDCYDRIVGKESLNDRWDMHGEILH